MRRHNGYIKRFLIGFTYFDAPSRVTQWPDKISHTIFRQYGFPKCHSIIGRHLRNKTTMFLVTLLFDNLQFHLRFGLKECLLPQERTVFIHLGEHE